MLVTEIREYAKSQGSFSIAQLQARFGLDRAHLKDILSRWVASGKLEQIDYTTPCKTGLCGGGCQSCPTIALELYRWKNN